MDGTDVEQRGSQLISKFKPETPESQVKPFSGRLSWRRMQCSGLAADRDQLAEAMLQCQPQKTIRQISKTLAVYVLLGLPGNSYFQVFESNRAWREIRFLLCRIKNENARILQEKDRKRFTVLHFQKKKFILKYYKVANTHTIPIYHLYTLSPLVITGFPNKKKRK